jgi:hypothetical protein
MSAALGAINELYRDADHALVFAAPLVVQVRRGGMTLPVLAQMDRRVREIRAAMAPGARVGAAVVIEAGAAVTDDHTRAEQRRVVNALIDGVDARLAIAVLGEGISSMLQRTVARGILFANKRVRVAASPEDAAAWIAPHLELTTATVLRVVEHARSLR